MSACTVSYAPVMISREQRERELLQIRRQRNSMSHSGHAPITTAPVLPSLRSLHLLTPPNSAEQKYEEDWHAAKADTGDRDFFVQGDDQGSFQGGRLFSGSAASSPHSMASRNAHSNAVSPEPITLNPISGCAQQSPHARKEEECRSHEVSQRSTFERLGVQEPSEEERQLCADFLMSLRGIEHTSPTIHHWASPPMHAQNLSPRSHRALLRPLSTNPPQPTRYASSERSATMSERSEFSPDSVVSDASSTGSRKRKLAIPRYTPRPSTAESIELSQAPASSKRRRQAPSAKRRENSASSTEAFISRQQKHVRGKPSKQRRSTNYLDYPDYAPPISVMQDPMTAAGAMKHATFKDSLDYSRDPLKGELHEAEIIAATRCHLNGSQYLCTKRQIFEAYVQHLRGERKGNWNKTAAQLVAGIDVQKSSKLWQFYHDVGWFDQKHFEKFL